MTDKDIERLLKMALESDVADEASRDVEKHEEVRKSAVCSHAIANASQTTSAT